MTATILVALLLIASTAAAAPTTDAYLHGYAAAVLERELRLTVPSLKVENGVVVLDARELAGADRAAVIAALARIPGVVRVDVLDASAPPATPERADRPAVEPRAAEPARPPRIVKEISRGVMPGGQLFAPLIADPRWPQFAAAHHYYLNDRDLENVGAVSLGESFTIYRDRLGRGWWELGVQAGVFAIFDLDAESKDLINADYVVGIPVAYRYDALAALFRVFHQSSHVGDEFILRNRVQNRLNLSYEAVDLRLSYDFGDVLRIYGGGGYLFDQDPPDLEAWSTQYGFELRSPWPDTTAGWRPIAAVDFQHREENNWHTDFSLRAGVQIEGVLPARTFQLLIEYFRGNSPNGQFYRQKIDYIGLGAHFHF